MEYGTDRIICVQHPKDPQYPQDVNDSKDVKGRSAMIFPTCQTVKDPFSNIMQNLVECGDGREIQAQRSPVEQCIFRQTSSSACWQLGALTMSRMCMECRYMTKDFFAWFAVGSHGKRTSSSGMVVGKWCANCGATYYNHICGCMVLANEWKRCVAN